MNVVSPGQVINAATPTLFFVFQDSDGAARDPFSLTYAIDDLTGSAPVEVAPPTAIDVSLLSVARFGLGAFAPSWVVPLDAATGAWRIRWSWQPHEDAPVRTAFSAFDVFPFAPSRRVYGRPSALRAKLPTTGPRAVSSVAIIEELEAAAGIIERFTRRRFYAERLSLKLDGRAPGVLLLGQVVIAVESIEIRAGYSPYILWSHDATLWRVYNRHLSGLYNPDDRDNPKIEFPSEWANDGGARTDTRRRTGFSRGVQNVVVNGWFGYTDADGSPIGKTPSEIDRVANLIVLDNVGAAGTGAWRVKAESTRDQSVTFGNAGGSANSGKFVGALTGNPLVDDVLLAFRAPPQMGAV